MTTMTALAPMSLRIDSSMRERLNRLAKNHKRSAHALAAEAVQDFVVAKEKEDAFNQSCIDSYNHYKETGLHVTQDEVEKWMDSWGTENELPMPTCHQ